jgi:hypothetical protein
VPQAGEAGAGIVHRQGGTELAHTGDRATETRVVLDARMLGHLEHHVIHVAAGQQREQVGALGGHR